MITIARFWASLDDHPVNERQRKVLGKLLEGWEGLVTTRKWAAICGCSADSAQRDIADLVRRGLLVPNDKGGRSTGYVFHLPGVPRRNGHKFTLSGQTANIRLLPGLTGGSRRGRKPSGSRSVLVAQ